MSESRVSQNDCTHLVTTRQFISNTVQEGTQASYLKTVPIPESKSLVLSEQKKESSVNEQVVCGYMFPVDSDADMKHIILNHLQNPYYLIPIEL